MKAAFIPELCGIAATCLVFLITSPLHSRTVDPELRAQIRQLTELRQRVLAAKNNELRNSTNKEFVVLLRKALENKSSFFASFDTIPQFEDLRSSDNFLRILNWNVPQDDQTHRYFCFLQFYDRKAKTHKIVELKQGYRNVRGEERKVFGEGDWYGALYYTIIPAKRTFRHRKKTYMLLGWDGHNQYSTIKLVDVLTITGNSIRFGADIFDLPDKNAKRLVLEFKADAYVSLKYHPERKQIVFNQLEPMQPDLVGMYEFYIPVMEFDALKWRAGKWHLIKNVNPTMGKDSKPYHDPPLQQKVRR